MPRDKDNGTESEGQLIAKRFGVEAIGATWMKTLLPEFKKPYIEEVDMCVCVCSCIYHKINLFPRSPDMSMLLPVSKNVYGCAVATCVFTQQDKRKKFCVMLCATAAAMLP